jgi:CHAT domain-containing protein/tetratricopeptide (TPR) repeat protein
MANDPKRDSQAWYLQNKGTRLREAGRTAEAHAYFVKALARFDANEVTFLAASVAYDLAISYRDLQVGKPVENLLKAKELAERAIANKERRRDPIRWANTWDVLGTIKRRLAEHVRPEHRMALLAEALADVKKAIQVGEDALRRFEADPSWARRVAGFYVSLGIHYLQVEKPSDAIAAYIKAIAKLEAGGDPRNDPDYNRSLHHATLNLANARIHRATAADLDDALRLSNLLTRTSDAMMRTRGHMIAASAYKLRGGPNVTAQLREHLKLVDYELLTVEQIPAFLEFSELAGEPSLGLQAVQAWIGHGFEEFSKTMAEPDGDAVSFRTQTLAYHGARAYHRLGRHLDAFIMLETVAAPRFDEAIKAQCLLPRSPLAAELTRRASVASVMASSLEELASLPVDSVRGVLENTEDELDTWLRSQTLAHVVPQTVKLMEVIRRARASAEPTSVLRSECRAATAEVTNCMAGLDRVEPRRAGILAQIDGEPRPHQILRIVAEYPDAVFVRLELRDELLVASCFVEAGGIEARSHVVPLSAEARRLIFSLWNEDMPDTASALLREIDLSPVLPSDRRARLVVLAPRSLAVLPVVAAGPAGRTPLDLFDSVVWLPSLAPLRVETPAQPPRIGTAVFVPDGTHYGRSAFAPLCEGNAVFSGAEAVHSAVASAARAADVLVFYTHGGHGEEEREPGIALTDGRLTPFELSWNWVGVERVELWACDSALERATNPRTSGLEGETFGLDGQLMRHGVRTTIAAQRPIREFIAVVLHAEYRRCMASGLAPDAALAGAMRHWRDVDFPDLLQRINSPAPIDVTLRAFLADRGLAVGGGTGAADNILGPVDSASPNEGDAETRALIASFSSPFEWASLRFLGIPNRRPTDASVPITETSVPQSDEVMKEADALLAEIRDERSKPSDDVQIEDEIRRLVAVVDADWTNARAVVELAEAFRVRNLGSTVDNLLMGLAWLYEALSYEQGELNTIDLRAKAATLWLHLAVTLGLNWVRVGLFSRTRACVEYARSALAGVPNDRSTGHRAILRLIDETRGPRRDIAAALREGSLKADEDDDSLWLLAEALEALASIDGGAKEELQDLLERGQTRLPRDADMGVVHWHSTCRLWFTLDNAAGAAGYQRQFPRTNFTFLVGRERIMATNWLEGIATPDAHEWLKQAEFELISKGLSEVECAVWGRLDPGCPQRFEGTGRPVPLYHSAVGGLVGANLRPGEPTHHLAGLIGNLHLGSDLRLLHLHRLAQWAAVGATTDRGEHLEEMRRNLRIRDAAMDALLTAVTEPFDAQRTARLDPFAQRPNEIHARVVGPEHASAWALSKLATLVEIPEVMRGVTAAYRSVRGARVLTDWLTNLWTSMLDAGNENPEFRAFGFPDRLGDLSLRIVENERWLLDLPSTDAVLHLGIHPDGRWWGCLVNSEHQRIAAASDADSAALTKAIVGTLGPDKVDFEQRGMAGGRGAAWTAVVRHLIPLLSDLLTAPIKDGVRRIMVFAPGALRGLPINCLETAAGPLGRQLDEIVHLPALRWAPAGRRSAKRLACLHNPEGDGTTSFSEAAVRTLREWFPPDLVVTSTDVGSREILEATVIESAALDFREIRLCSLGAWFGFTSESAGLELPGNRWLSDHNMWSMNLGNTELVELWAATGPKMAEAVFHGDDRIPGLARSFLAAGAASVLDTAWPVHDLVKALVSETFGMLHHGRGAPPSIALTRAVLAVGHLLGQWQAAGPHASVDAALTWLDAQRAVAAKALGLAAHKVVPFPAPAPNVTPEPAVFVTEVCQPSHLAAFRLWGAL